MTEAVKAYLSKLDFIYIIVLFIASAYSMTSIVQLPRPQMAIISIASVFLTLPSIYLYSKIEENSKDEHARLKFPLMHIMFAVGLAYLIYLLVTYKSITVFQDQVFSQAYAFGKEYVYFFGLLLLIPVIIQLTKNILEKLKIYDPQFMLLVLNIGLIVFFFYIISNYLGTFSNLPDISWLFIGFIPLGWIQQLYIKPFRQLVQRKSE